MLSLVVHNLLSGVGYRVGWERPVSCWVKLGIVDSPINNAVLLKLTNAAELRDLGTDTQSSNNCGSTVGFSPPRRSSADSSKVEDLLKR